MHTETHSSSPLHTLERSHTICLLLDPHTIMLIFDIILGLPSDITSTQAYIRARAVRNVHSVKPQRLVKRAFIRFIKKKYQNSPNRTFAAENSQQTESSKRISF